VIRVEIPTKIGLKIGAKGKEVDKLQGYLKRIGFIRPDEEAPYGFRVDLLRAAKQPKPNTFDATTKEALRHFQEFYKLPVSGILDKATVNLMLRPRCGVPDLIVAAGGQDYVYSGRKWEELDLTYVIQNFTADFSENDAKRAIKDAFNQWSSKTPLTFTEVSSGADFKLSWGTRNHGNCSSFDGPSGILAHAFSPEDGRVHFDDDELWTDALISLGRDFASVVLHELGHALGLGHSNDPFAVMYAYYMGRRRSLSQDDIAGIQSIYGANNGTEPNGGCTIARIISGSTFAAMHSNLLFLRKFRDEVLLKSMFRTSLEKILRHYYRFTPIINRKMEVSSVFKKLVKCTVYFFMVSAKKAASLALAYMRIRDFRIH
jgi:hypothetical protein